MADRILKAWPFGLAAAVLGGLLATLPATLRLEENAGLGALFQLRGSRPVPPEVVVVSLDKASSDALGLPNEPRKWPRELHAALIGRLSAAGAAVIAFDMLFDEPDTAAGDARLADAVAAAGNVVLTAFLRKSVVGVARDEQLLVTAEQVVAPLPALAAGALAVAPFPLPVVPVKVSQFWTFKASAGGVPTLPPAVFQAAMLIRSGDWLKDLRRVCPGVARALPARPADVLATRNVVQLLRTARECLAGNAQGIATLRAAWKGAPAVLPGSLLELYAGDDVRYLNYYGPPRSVATLPYAEALRADPGSLAGRIVLVGFSEQLQHEQKDSFYSVFSDASGLNLSGVEIAATAIANMLDGSAVRPLGIVGQLLVVGLWGLLVGALCRLLQPPAAVAFCLVAVPLFVAWAWWVFAATNVWLPLVVPLAVQLPAALVLGLLAQYRQTRTQRERVLQALGSYLPRPAVNRLMENLGDLKANAELLYGTCLATDGEQYTRLAEALSPDELAAFMNGYYEAMFAEVERHGGVVTDVVGDSMMAIWAAATPSVAARARACAGALAIAAAVGRFNATPGQPSLPTRIGLHTGQIRLGNIGGAHRVEFRAVGDIVNTASRIDGLNKRLGTRILVSGETLAGVDGFLTREVGTFLLAGKSAPLVVHELHGSLTDALPELNGRIARFAGALDLFRARRWQEASEALGSLQHDWPGDGPVRFYLDLCQRCLAGDLSSIENGAVRLSDK
jgi:adenylate cyclase